MPRFGLISLTLAGLAATSVAAVEVVPAFVDMRLDLQAAGLDYALDVNGTESDQSFDTGARLGVSWIGSLGLSRSGGCLWGLGLHWNWNDDELKFGGASPTGQLQVYTIDAYLGYGLPFGENLQLEVLPVVGIGQAYLHLSRPLATGEQSDHGTVWEVGLLANLTYTFAGGFQVGGTAGYYRSEANDIGIAPSNYSFTLNRVVVGGFLGFRL
jgi:hypothetical protein